MATEVAFKVWERMERERLKAAQRAAAKGPEEHEDRPLLQRYYRQSRLPNLTTVANSTQSSTAKCGPQMFQSRHEQKNRPRQTCPPRIPSKNQSNHGKGSITNSTHPSYSDHNS
ncbi:unnamed protein product [Taenia asiatica]|uniref:HMG box domain-containing protein n=1 Tax=Taenia asiatica TaxID=60517 RepID=A0A0R3W366_TAEAS|nr:unnamed protein product [Taenia asiatica]